MIDRSMESRADSPLRRAALGFWVVLLIGIVAKCVLAPTVHSVYPVYAETGRDWWLGSATESAVGVDLLKRQYAPFFAELMAPFCLLPDRLGGALWSVLSVAVFLTGFDRLLRTLPARGVTQREWGWAMLLVPWFGVASLFNGQANTLIAGCLLWAVVLVKRERWFAAALLLAVPACIKTYPAAMALTLIWLHPRKLGPRFLLASLFLCALPFVTHPAAEVAARYRSWVDFLGSGQHYESGLTVIDLRTFLATWAFEISPRAYLPVQLAAAGFVLAGVQASRRRGEPGARTLLDAYVSVSLWMVLFGPATEEATYLLAAPAVAWTLVEAERQRNLSSERIPLGLLAAFTGPLQSSILGEPLRRWVLAWRLAPLALAVLFGRHLHRCLVGVDDRSHLGQSRPNRSAPAIDETVGAAIS